MSTLYSQMQWTFAPPAGRPATLADIILTRVLERYGLHTPTRTTLQFRTYRTTTSTSTTSSDPTSLAPPAEAAAAAQADQTRYLTVITTLTPPTSATPVGADKDKDDTGYIFLDDRSANSNSSGSNGSSSPLVPAAAEAAAAAAVPFQPEGRGAEAGTESETAAVDPPPPPRGTDVQIDVPSLGGEGVTNGVGSMEDDGFEIIDAPPAVTDEQGAPATATSAAGKVEAGEAGEAGESKANADIQMTDTTDQVQPQPQAPPAPPSSSSRDGKTQVFRRYHILPVRPGAAFVPMLQSLLSPFVLGLTKSARATASTTNSTPVPTPLPGSSLLLTVLSFIYTPEPTSHDATYIDHSTIAASSGSDRPTPIPITLRMYILPNPTAQSIFLEAEYTPSSSSAAYRHTSSMIEQKEMGVVNDEDEDEGAELRAFLEDCLPAGVAGQRRFVPAIIEDASTSKRVVGPYKHSSDGRWDSLERTKRSVYTLARTLREGGFI